MTEDGSRSPALQGDAVRNSCPGWPLAAQPQDHAWTLMDWLRRTPAAGDGQDASRWESVGAWLSLAAGLRRVEVDLAERGSAGYMCSSAWPYEDALSETASTYHTELTRLLYVYCAFENTVRSLRPDLKEGAPVVPIARQFLTTKNEDVLAHYYCELRRLRWHVDNDSRLASNKDLLKQFEPGRGHDESVVGMQVGAKFRHLFAHGDLTLPQPRSTSDSWQQGGQAELCVAKHATTCLLMTLQLLFRYGLDVGALVEDESFLMDDGLWVPSPQGGEWTYEATATERILNLHLLQGQDLDR